MSTPSTTSTTQVDAEAAEAAAKMKAQMDAEAKAKVDAEAKVEAKAKVDTEAKVETAAAKAEAAKAKAEAVAAKAEAAAAKAEAAAAALMSVIYKLLPTSEQSQQSFNCNGPTSSDHETSSSSSSSSLPQEDEEVVSWETVKLFDKSIKVPKNVLRTRHNEDLLKSWIQRDANNQSPSVSLKLQKKLQLSKISTVFKSGDYSEFQEWKEKFRKKLPNNTTSPQSSSSSSKSSPSIVTPTAFSPPLTTSCKRKRTQWKEDMQNALDGMLRGSDADRQTHRSLKETLHRDGHKDIRGALLQ